MRDRIATHVALGALLATLAACNDGSSAASSPADAVVIASSVPMDLAVRATAASSTAPQTGLVLSCPTATASVQFADCPGGELVYAVPAAGVYVESSSVATTSVPAFSATTHVFEPYQKAVAVVTCTIAETPELTVTYSTDPCTQSHAVVVGPAAAGASSSMVGPSSSSSSGGLSSGSSSGSSSSSGGSSSSSLVSAAPQTGLVLSCPTATVAVQFADCLGGKLVYVVPAAGVYVESSTVATTSMPAFSAATHVFQPYQNAAAVVICRIAETPGLTVTYSTDPCSHYHAVVAGPAAGGSSSGSGGSSSGSSSGGSSSGSSSGGRSSSSGSSGGGSSGSSSGGSSSGGSSSGSSSSSSGGTGPAAQLAAKLGAPSRLLLGQEESGTPDDIAAWESLGLPHPDMYQRYLTGLGWTSWNKPAGAYATLMMQKAGAAGAIPFFTLYQISGNIWMIANQGEMATYWANYKLLLQLIAAYGKPVLINFEPDGWGYMEKQHQDATLVFAYVQNNPDCADEPNNAVGMGHCLLSMRAKYAPNAYVGFPYSDWGGTAAQVTAFMRQVGAGQADYIVGGTLDVSAGCLEAYASQPATCQRGTGGQIVYWDETNTTHPNFHDAFDYITSYRSGIGGNLPIIWWQTPVGVPSPTPGGTMYHYRDNRVDYFLKHPTELTAIGTLAVSFVGTGGDTTILTDGGQFKTLAGAYFAAPVPLP